MTSRKVTARTSASPAEERKSTPIAVFSTMFHATTASMPASAASGT